MAGQARRWAEATAPQAHRRQVGEAGPRRWLRGPAWAPSAPGTRGRAPCLGGSEWSPESEPKAGTLNLAKEWLAAPGTPGGEEMAEAGSAALENWTLFRKSGIQETDQKEK